MASVFERDTSTIGTVVGIVVLIIALLGNTFLGWEYGGVGPPLVIIIGGLAAIAAGWFSFQKLRN